MKRCPTCSRVYDNVSLRFCFDDGTELVNKVPDQGPPATAVMPSPENAQPPLQASPPHALPGASPIPPTIAVRKTSLLPWVLGASAVLLLFGAGAIAAFLLRPSQRLVVHLVLEVAQTPMDRDTAVKQSVNIIESRLDAIGISNYKVKPGEPGTGRILVDLPALPDPERVKKVIGNWGKLELVHVISAPNPAPFQLYDSEYDATVAINESGQLSGNRRVLRYLERDFDPQQEQIANKWVVVEVPPIVDGNSIRNASATSYDGKNYGVSFTLTSNAAARFGAWTGSHINEYLGVVLNDEVKTIAFIKSQINDQGEITGSFTKQSAEDLALILRAGAFPAPVQFIDEKIDKP